MSKATVNNLSHLFYIDPIANEYLPQWFVELATREDAEQMLSRSTGSVLMRSHPSFKSTGKYVITYRKGTDCFKHYLLLNTPDGFRLEIEHKNNRPVNCLSDAMDLFVKLVGRSAQPINCYGSSSDYVNINGGIAVENTMKTNINSSVSGNVGSSTGSLQQSSHDYINTPHASATKQLSINVPSSPEALSSVQPIHIYLNAPQISAVSSTSKFCPEETKRQNITKEPRSYINMQQLSSAEENTYVEIPGSGSRPTTTADDFPSNIAPTPPQQN